MTDVDTQGDGGARAADGMTPGEAAAAAQQATEHASPGQHDTSSLWKPTTAARAAR